MSQIKNDDTQYIANTYKRFDLVISHAHGSKIYDENQNQYIDLGTGIAVNALGACNTKWKRAVKQQIDLLTHCSNLYYSQPQTQLAKTLCERTGMGKVFFSNSGAEANECLIKCARKYSSGKYGQGRNKIITLVNSFHGRTVTTLSVTGQDVFHKDFAPFTDGFIYVPANDTQAMKKAMDDPSVCAVLVELVQGEGGVMPLDKDYVTAIYRYAADKDILFTVDEVQTGNGRSGSLYAYMNYGISPDIVSTAKGLGGGLPIGATMLSHKCENVLSAGDHGSTFGGNPVCAAGAISILAQIDDKLLASVKKKSKYIFDNLSGASGVESVSGLGLMIGIKTVKPAAEIVKNAMDKGIIVLTAKDRVRLLPALNIPMGELKKAVTILKEVIKI